jgi:hypothetical protein
VAHYGDVSHLCIPPLLSVLHRVDLGSDDGLARLVEVVRSPISIEEYCAEIASHPVIETALASVPHVEPPQFLPVILSEVDFKFGDPLRITRTTEKPISFEGLSSIVSARGSGRAVFLIGEAGIGKTTLCRLLRREFAAHSGAQHYLPILIALGNWDSDSCTIEQVIDRDFGFSTLNALLSDEKFKRRVIVFLDGVNEQNDHALVQVFAFARRIVLYHQGTVVLTSRPVTSVNRLLGLEDLRLFEIKRWTEDQVQTYLRNNGHGSLLSEVPQPVRNCLRLPLIASLFVRRLLYETEAPKMRTVTDVFAYILDQFISELRPSFYERNGDTSAIAGREFLVGYLAKVAFRMTELRVVQCQGDLLKNSLGPKHRRRFKAITKQLVNGGLLRCSNAIVALNPRASCRELTNLKFTFLHQSLQEYLTCLRLRAIGIDKLPPDVSHDAFWREIPIYLVRYEMGSPTQQRDLALKFLKASHPDYLTSARMADEIQERAVRVSLRETIAQALVKNMESDNPYPFLIEAFAALDKDGVRALRRCISDAAAIEQTVAEAERHLIRNGSDPDISEAAWRRIGRAIYVLGELGDVALFEILMQHVHSIQSIHLIYHLGEAALTVIRRRQMSSSERDLVSVFTKQLRQHRSADPVIRGQVAAERLAFEPRIGRSRRLAAELRRFLTVCASPANPQFKQEFWGRAHGIEAFAEIATLPDCLELLTHICLVEDEADYSNYPEPGYRLVPSSILKSISRLCDAYPHRRSDWRPLLESMFYSERIGQNAWACRHLEALLLKSFSTDADLEWIRRFQQSSTAVAPSIRVALSNVVWLST